MSSGYWLKNVKMESGYERDGDQITGTRTELVHIRIENERITDISPAKVFLDDKLPKYDAKQQLLLPSFRESHLHLDKTFYGGPWQAVRPAGSIFKRIEQEKKLLPELLPVAEERASKLLDLILGHGSTYVRGHVNIDPVSGLKGLEAVKRALGSFQNKIDAELVAFTQHGLLRSQSEQLVREAVRNGATHIGSVDPAVIDGDREKSLNTLMEIAVEENVNIDIHVHESGAEGVKTLSLLARLTENAGWKGRVTVSHAFAFATPDFDDVKELASRFAELEIDIASTVPIGRLHMPLPALHDMGVRIGLGNDSIIDHWSPFGMGDALEKAQRFAELYGRSQEYGLSQTLGFITGGITPLNAEGERVWPYVGAEASVVLVDASCAAEAVARRCSRTAVIHRGQLAAGTLTQIQE
ncbi:amidohydrolase [Paenibacillus sp. DMB20]|uniref:amidohydrolase n=1 Tax=Paenibacillus sp. DMB20 TaxID=1642570 RepID=UPI00062817C0|nr:amidohydrolase [Paenibacillus sp. DMB20]KKO55556.1 deaminase [Paenibacillus sp. DMB20]